MGVTSYGITQLLIPILSFGACCRKAGTLVGPESPYDRSYMAATGPKITSTLNGSKNRSILATSSAASRVNPRTIRAVSPVRMERT